MALGEIILEARPEVDDSDGFVPRNEEERMCPRTLS
jgi:hypothetical protein